MEKRVEREKDTREITTDKEIPVRKKQRPPRSRKGKNKGQNQPQDKRKEFEGTQEKATKDNQSKDIEGKREQLRTKNIDTG